MPGRTIAVRRSRLAIENEEDADSVRAESRPSSPSSDSVKRPRLNRDHYDMPGHSSSRNGTLQQSRRSVNGNANGHINNASQRGEGEFQPGAIVRVKVTNFITYEKAEFFPGPNLNMVIGPNGTGKSSLVCAICLGLGWPPQLLGRASSFGEFVKHGMKEAYVEIELQGREGEDNIVIKVQIIREGNKREWWVNNRKCSLKAVQAVMEKFNVQIDNLCQFLPQDKVSEFAAMSPVELLQATQRAAAPPEMVNWHEGLKRLRKDQKALQVQNEMDQETLTNYEGRQQNLRAEVEKLQRRNEIQERISLLERAIPLVEYREAKRLHTEFKGRKQDAENKLKELEREVEPLMQSVNKKEAYEMQINVVVNERKKAVDQAERAADSLVAQIEQQDEEITGNETEIKAQRANEAVRKQEVQKYQAKIREIEAAIQRGRPEFDAKKWNAMIGAKEREERAIEDELKELAVQDKEYVTRGREIRSVEQVRAKQELESLDSQQGRQINKLERASNDTAKLWKWVQDHKDQFEMEVYGPPMITCSVRDSSYTDAVEALFSNKDFFTITTQCYNDDLKIVKATKALRLSDVHHAIARDTMRDPPFSKQELQGLGLDAWAADLIEGPAPVLNVLFGGSKGAAIGLRELSDSQFERIVQSRQIPKFVNGDQVCASRYRHEYNQSSTVTKPVQPARYWTDTPVDQTARSEIEAKLAALEAEFNMIQEEQVRPLRQKIAKLKSRLKELKDEIIQNKKDKSAEQVAQGQWDVLPNKRRRQEEALELKEREGDAFRERMKDISIKHDNDVLKKARLGIRHKELVAQIRSCHEELLEAEFRQLEAASDVEALKNKNVDNAQRLEEERQKLKDATRESAAYKARATQTLRVAQAVLAEAEEEDGVTIKALAEEQTVEELNNEIAAEGAKLELIHAGNPNAIKEFERRQAQLEELKAKIQASDKELETFDHEITVIRTQWEPRLDDMVTSISDAFALNFETIGCNGEVSVHKDDDFDLWAIQIKVKFRENETLQLLDAHRQSGGERSVSTIFYLMALQSLARSPFRVVDEINQGMDPRNERMVHERMVDIACQEYTSQYFLITPKLLTGLRYDRRMKVLCIASGEYMPSDYKKLDVSKIIGIRKAMIAA